MSSYEIYMEFESFVRICSFPGHAEVGDVVCLLQWCLRTVARRIPGRLAEMFRDWQQVKHQLLRGTSFQLTTEREVKGSARIWKDLKGTEWYQPPGLDCHDLYIRFATESQWRGIALRDHLNEKKRSQFASRFSLNTFDVIPFPCCFLMFFWQFFGLRVINLILHTSDISNSMKPFRNLEVKGVGLWFHNLKHVWKLFPFPMFPPWVWSDDLKNGAATSGISRIWAWQVLEEFFVQGDAEARLGVCLDKGLDVEPVNKFRFKQGQHKLNCLCWVVFVFHTISWSVRNFPQHSHVMPVPGQCKPWMIGTRWTGLSPRPGPGLGVSNRTCMDLFANCQLFAFSLFSFAMHHSHAECPDRSDSLNS